MSKIITASGLPVKGTGATDSMPVLAPTQATGGGFLVWSDMKLSLALLCAGMIIPASDGIGFTHGKGTFGISSDVPIAPRDYPRRQTPRSTASLVTEIKAIFGLSVTQLGAILQVSRQMVYKWLDEGNPSIVQPKNRGRLDQIYALAQEWRVRSKRAIGKDGETVRLAGTQSLMDLLSAENVDVTQVKEAMTVLAARLIKNDKKFQYSGNRRASREVLAAYSRTIGSSSEDDT